MGRNRSGILSTGFLAVMVLILLSGSFFTPGVESHLLSPIFSAILGVISLGCICLSLYYINDSFFLVAKDSVSLPLIYLLLILTYPQAVYFSFYHIAALLFLWGLYFNVRYVVEEDKKMSSLFLSTLLFSSVILIIPAFLWMVAALFFVNVASSKMNFFRYTAVYIAGFLLTPLYYLSIGYLFLDMDFSAVAEAFSSSLTTISFKFEHARISYLFMIGMIVVLSLRSFFFLLRHKSDFNTISAKSYSRGFSLAVLVLLLYLVYFGSIDPMIQLIIYIPVSVMFFAFLKSMEKKTEASVFMTLLLLSILIGRISFFW